MALAGPATVRERSRAELAHPGHHGVADPLAGHRQVRRAVAWAEEGEEPHPLGRALDEARLAEADHRPKALGGLAGRRPDEQLDPLLHLEADGGVLAEHVQLPAGGRGVEDEVVAVEREGEGDDVGRGAVHHRDAADARALQDPPQLGRIHDLLLAPAHHPPSIGEVGPRSPGAPPPRYSASSQRAYASNSLGRPRKSTTSSAAGFEPPASRIALRYFRAGPSLMSPASRNGPKRSFAITNDHMYV